MLRSLFAVMFLLGLVGNSSEAPTATALNPPGVTVLLNSPGQADGLIFIAPKGAGIGGGPQPGPVGPEIVDSRGPVIWFSPVTNGQVAADFRVQSYRGKPVLTRRAPTNDPRLLASQRFARDQQVSPGNDKKQTSRTGEACGCHPARWCVVGKQINPDPVAREVHTPECFGGRKSEAASAEMLIGPKRTQIDFRGSL